MLSAIAKKIRIQKASRGFTMVEIAVTLLIVVALTTIFVMTLLGSRSGDSVDRATQSIYDDLIFVRSRAVSSNRNHRLNFSSVSQWRLESFNDVTSAWDPVGDIRFMPSDTYLTDIAFGNAAANLEATPRGLFMFQNSASGSPYVTVTALGATKTKSINVFLGGALEVRTP